MRRRVRRHETSITTTAWRRGAAGALAVTLVLIGAACSLASSPTPRPAPTPPPKPAAGIWKPRPGTTWQWQITGTVDTTVSPAAMYDIDLSDAMPSARTVRVPGFGTVNWPKGPNAGVVDRLHRLGKVVVCYLDSGAWESYRPDAALFPASVIGNSTGWDGERWLDLRPASRARFAPLIWSRMDVARSIGCDGIEPDQNNPIGNSPGFPITTADQTSWYLQVATQVHARHLSVGMKNGIESINAATVSAFDWALNEECFQYDECGTLAPFVRAGKAVFQVEYQGNPATYCPVAKQDGFSTMKKHLDLGSWRQTCF